MTQFNVDFLLPSGTGLTLIASSSDASPATRTRCEEHESPSLLVLFVRPLRGRFIVITRGPSQICAGQIGRCS